MEDASQPAAWLLAEAADASALQRGAGCSRPIRLRGRTEFVNTQTGEVRPLYDSADELDGTTYVRCGNRRASVCPTCSHEYKGDAWHLIVCGLAGGKGVPAAVAERPCTFITLTAPSFGAVHGSRGNGACRPRRDKPLCAHGRPLWCSRSHGESDPQVGQPLCGECYDYLGHVLWQWHAPELWRRFTISLQRELAKAAGLTVKAFKGSCKISYSKVVEFQARGVIHIHAPIRLDGPGGADGPASTLALDTADLERAVRRAAARVTLESSPLRDGKVYLLRWGSQLDTRTITAAADRESGSRVGGAHPEQVAAYLAKYLTKTTEDFGLPAKVLSATHARAAGATPHAVRLVRTAAEIAREGGPYERLSACLATLGYRGHPITKSRAYGVTFGQLRRARRVFRQGRAGLDPDADIRELLDEVPPDGYELISSFVYVGRGYLELDAAVAAVRSAALARADRDRLSTANQ